MKSVLLGTVLWILTSPSFAQGVRQVDAHVHGTGHLEVAIAGETVRIGFHAPGADLVGFERRAKNDTERLALQKAVAALGAPMELFGYPRSSDCYVTEAKVELLEGAHGGHAEFQAEYALHCADPGSIDQMSFGYFDAFPRARKLIVYLISDAGSARFDVVRNRTELDLAGRMTVLAIAMSVALYLGVEKLRIGAKASFAETISGTDLIVGARTGSVQLLLDSVFRIGSATNNFSWESYRQIAQRPEVDWAVPISLGDSHRQFRVMGTTQEFFVRCKYRGDQALELEEGAMMADLFDAVIGAEVAETLGYTVGTPMVVSHGIASFTAHDDQPFRVAGILARTGTPVDRTVTVSLEATEAIHVDWQSGSRAPGAATAPDVLRAMDLQPKAITAAIVGVTSRLEIFGLQRWINGYPEEALMAVLPGVAQRELWQIVGIAERAVCAVSAMVVITALIGMVAVISASLSERRREMAIWRAMGAPPHAIVGLLVLEATLVASAGTVIGILLLFGGLSAIQPFIEARIGLQLPVHMSLSHEILPIASIVGAAALARLMPAYRAYRMSLADGMTVTT